MAAPTSETPRIRVAAIMQLDGRLVLVRHVKDGSEYYLLPGGGVDWGETLPEALVREVSEETSLTCSPGPLAHVSDSIAPDGSRHVVQITFLARVVSGTITSAPEDERVAAVELVDPERLSQLDLRPPVATAVIDALRGAEAPGSVYLGAPWTPEQGDL